MTPSTQHTPDAELIDAYVTGGLAADERAAFEAHLRNCPTCQSTVASARSSDEAMRNLFDNARPTAGFEDRMIRAVREERSPRLRIPLPVRRAAAVAAAVLLVGGVGYIGNGLIENGNGLDRVLAASNLRQLGQAILLYTNENKQEYSRTHELSARQPVSIHPQDGQNVLYGDGHVKTQNNPFQGTQRDKIFTGRTSQGSPKRLESTDNILLPTDDEPAKEKQGQSYQEHPSAGNDAKALPPPAAFKPEEFVLGRMPAMLDGKNAYGANIVVSSGTLSLATTASGKPIDAPQAAIAGVANGDAGNHPSAPQTAPPPTTTTAVDSRRIIRNGTMEFEVDSFDAAVARITQIVGESGGFVGTVDSQKLPNGKVKGTVTLRVPPERLDALVLSLRALGDLKSQQISAQDITKQYTDIQSQLTAARAMESRLLELIKSGNGAIKDLLAAEKELGVWREKIEQAEGEIRYYNNLVSLSTLSITIYERDIKTPAAATETETADVGIEAEDVEGARTDAIKAIEDANGRTIESELKRFDAGQLAARIVADVPPESAGPVIDRLKQLGRAARLEVHRQQTPADGSEPTTAGTTLRVDRKPTRLLISLYNLANVAPRRTTNITLASADVEATYAALLAQAKGADGRIVTSSVDRGDPAKASGSLVLELSPEKFDSALSAVRGQGDVLKLAAVENPDTQNTTLAKQGLTIQLVSLASVQPRETVQQTIATAAVPAAYHAILDAASAAHGRVTNAQLNENDRQNITGVIDVEVPRSELASMENTIATAGDSVARAASRTADAENTVDSKVLLRMSIVAADRLPPRETTTMQVEVGDATKSTGDAQTIALASGGTVLDATTQRDRGGAQRAHVVLDVPLSKAGDVLNQLRGSGVVRAIESSRDANAPTGALARARLDVTYATADAIVSGQSSLWSSIRNGLATSIAGLLLSVRLLVIGLCLVGPWLAMLWIAWRLWRRRRPTTTV
ncbi:MAG TPA: DUF4349 domain-containing protein [Tepidisphaeraceae bacterium]|nr:DUF4349 domain-containing protein [Tepidisphaeraceae bacterium]